MQKSKIEVGLVGTVNGGNAMIWYVGIVIATIIGAAVALYFVLFGW